MNPEAPEGEAGSKAVPPAEDLILPLVEAALAEDVGSGDATSLATIPADLQGTAEIEVREPGVICGLPVAWMTFREVDSAVMFKAVAADGERVAAGQVVARIQGPARALLTAERVALNFVQRLSGIATRTAEGVAILAGTGVRLLDTRKTIPGLRHLSKYAVRCGGGVNHRMGLYDMILIKENHVLAAGGITAAIERARAAYPHLKLSVEVTQDRELAEALDARPDRVLLDNFTVADLKLALEQIREHEREHRRRPEVEVSGGITPGNARSFAQPGVDYLSSGSLTHSAPALDLAMELRLVFPTEHETR